MTEYEAGKAALAMNIDQTRKDLERVARAIVAKEPCDWCSSYDFSCTGKCYDDIKHVLKSWVGLFEPISKGLKTHELRVLDRDYQVGDVCLLLEYEPTTKKYTGRWARVEITYITSDKHNPCAFSPYALHSAMGVLSIKLLPLNKNGTDVTL